MVSETVTYAIGDVHGEAVRLNQLHGLIFERHALSFGDAPLRIVHLGDFIDRGPDSCGVIDIVMQLETRGDCEVINLRGNHEQMLLDAVNGAVASSEDMWLFNGGEEAMESYRRRGFDDVPAEHVAWIDSLPTLYADMETRTAYVHAGIDVKTFPHCPESVRMWTRSARFFDTSRWAKNPNLEGWRVVHGHTPTEDFFPETDGEGPRRINLDTGAVFGGRLTAGILAPGEPVAYLYA